MLHDLGPLGYLALLLGAVGALLALATLALLLAKRAGAVKVVGLLSLAAAGGVLTLGALGHALGMTAVLAAARNVPFDVKDELLLKGTVEARTSLLIALLAAALPWLVGSIAMLLTRFRVGLGVAVVVTVGLAFTLVGYERPLPPGKVTLAPVEGLQLPQSTAQRRPGVQPLVALTPEGLWVEGAKVTSVALALEDARVREQNPDVLALAVDKRVSFSALVEVLEAAGRAKRHAFDLVVQSQEGELAAIRVGDAASVPPEPDGRPSLRLTLRVTGEQVEVQAVGGALDPLPLDWHQVQAKLMEVKTNFPDQTTLRITAADEVSMEVLVKALDATRETEQRKWLFPDAVVGHFESPVMPLPGAATIGSDALKPDVDSGEIDPERLAAYARSRRAAIQECYENELKHDSTLKGRIVVRFNITPSGRTSDLDIEENTLGSDAVARCLKTTIRGWVLPFRPTSDVPIAYPFVFAPAS